MRLIDGIDISADRLTVRADAGFTRRYLLDDFFVEYSEDIGLDRMPRSIALAPFVLNVAPLVWFSDETWRIDELDAELADSLAALRGQMQALYPAHRWHGRLVADRLSDNRPGALAPADDEPVAVLFSGGVDSVHTSFRALPRRQLLITVWGNETALDDEARWRLVRDERIRFARQFGHRNLFIESNAKEMIRRKRIRPDIPIWWLHVQLGMAMGGLCLPLLHRLRRPFVCISASEYRGGNPDPLGTSPEIDEAVRCAGIGVRHVGFDASRPEKLAFIVDKVAQEGWTTPRLAVCSRPSAQGSNCETCHKCLHSMAAVLMGGGRLRDFGFTRDERAVAVDIRTGLEGGRIRMNGGLVYEWLAVQRAAAAARQNGRLDAAPDEVKAFAAWLCEIDLRGYVARYFSRPDWLTRAKWLASDYPRLFELVRRTVERRGWFGY